MGNSKIQRNLNSKDLSENKSNNLEIITKNYKVENQEKKLLSTSKEDSFILNNCESKENSQNKNISITLNNYVIVDSKERTSDQENKQQILSKIDESISKIEDLKREKIDNQGSEKENEEENNRTNSVVNEERSEQENDEDIESNETISVDNSVQEILFGQKNNQENAFRKNKEISKIDSSIQEKMTEQESIHDVLSRKYEKNPKTHRTLKKSISNQKKTEKVLKKDKDISKKDNLIKKTITVQKNDQKIVKNNEVVSKNDSSIKKEKIPKQENKEKLLSKNEENDSNNNSSVKEKNHQNGSSILKNNDILCLGVRHREGKGIGYTHGYTTFEGQYYKPLIQKDLLLFVDLRMHFFNNGTYAANTGIGTRYRSNNSGNVYGLNIYYDSRKKKEYYNQISFGLECLGDVDFCFSGNIPIENRKTLTEVNRTNYAGGYYMDELKYNAALVNIFLEIGKEIERSKYLSIYGAIGQYYFEVNKCDAVFGGKTRVKFCVYNMCDIEFSASYDSHYKFRGQAMLGFHYCFGESKNKKSQKSIHKYPFHNDIIPVGERIRYYWNW